MDTKQNDLRSYVHGQVCLEQANGGSQELMENKGCVNFRGCNGRSRGPGVDRRVNGRPGQVGFIRVDSLRESAGGISLNLT
jgi:hypothetical protein